MELSIYIGGHETTTEHFISTLKKNKDALDAENIICFPMEDNTFHSVFRASKAIQKGGEIETIQAELLQRLTGVQDANKLLVVDYRVIDQKHRAIEKAPFFPKPESLVKQLQVIFQTYDIHIFTKIRNLATFIPSCYANRIFNYFSSSFEDFLATINIDDMLWSKYIERMENVETIRPRTLTH